MAVDYVERTNFWLTDAGGKVLGPDPLEGPCTVLFLYNNDPVNNAVVSLESSDNASTDVDYWTQVNFNTCNDCDLDSITMVPLSFRVIIFSIDEAYLRIRLADAVPGGVQVNMLQFAASGELNIEE